MDQYVGLRSWSPSHLYLYNIVAKVSASRINCPSFIKPAVCSKCRIPLRCKSLSNDRERRYVCKDLTFCSITRACHVSDVTWVLIEPFNSSSLHSSLNISHSYYSSFFFLFYWTRQIAEWKMHVLIFNENSRRNGTGRTELEEFNCFKLFKWWHRLKCTNRKNLSCWTLFIQPPNFSEEKFTNRYIVL